MLDLSASLKRNNAFDDMQAAARGFLQNFDDNIDQCGIVTYSTWGEERMPLRKNFTSTGVSIIDGLFAISDTNIQEGLRVAKAQFDAATPRETAIKVLELFTDGRPTALADNFWTDGATDTCAADTTGAATGALRFSPTGDSGTGLLGSALGAAPGSTSSGAGVDSDGDGTPDCYAGVVACYISGNSYRGLFRQSTGQKVAEFRSNGTIRYVANGSTASSPKPNRLPDGSVVNGKNIRRLGVEYAEIWANEDGVVNASQPQGAMLFAPTPADLEDTFTKLADRILTRLTR